MMPQLSFSEKDVQCHVLSELQKYYSRRSCNLTAAAAIEQINSKNGKRADGLLVIRQGSRLLTVSLEVKSDITSDDLNLAYEEQKGLALSGIIGSLLYLVIIYLIWQFGPMQHLTPMWGMASVGILSLGIIPMYKWLSRKRPGLLRRVKALRQLSQYPANEQWLAFAYNAQNPTHTKRLSRIKKYCQKAGVGLALVRLDRNWKVQYLIQPKFKFGNGRNILKDYNLSPEMQKQVRQVNNKAGLPFFFPTVAQWVLILKGFGLVLLVSFPLMFGINHTQSPRSKANTFQGAYPMAKSEISTSPGLSQPRTKTSEKTHQTPNQPDPRNNCQLPSYGYILVDSQYDTQQQAQRRAQHLENLGFGQCSIIWMPCAGRATEKYGVQVGGVLKRRSKAYLRFDQYRNGLYRAGDYDANPKIVKF